MTLEHVLRRSIKREAKRQDMLLARAVRSLVEDLELPEAVVAQGTGLPESEITLILEGAGLYARVPRLGAERARWLCERLIELGAERGPTPEMVGDAVRSLPRLVAAPRAASPRGRAA